ncbi:cell division protein ZapE [Gallaecimonas mangrovi]|uniref:cell division protein ZapE n=1 Tax=Gallaecimonas mangrovi TaxID=2291597 RepID=UPI000E20B912|nr:cell division protein ZapE [Gallaecimonas mangrovi]
MTLSPLQRYQAQLNTPGFAADAAQAAAAKALETLYQQLKEGSASKGLYLWGDVGRGKTMLMDWFYDALPPAQTRRQHFHHFMKWLHQQLNLHSGQQEPLAAIASELSRSCKVLCFDEFFVSDIGDAMLIRRLFESLFAKGLVLVATSNVAIDNLFQQALQRERFLPGIALLKHHCQALHLEGGADHRLRHLSVIKTCFRPGEEDFTELFSRLEPRPQQRQHVQLCGRTLDAIKCGEQTVWMDFQVLCNGPRSALDYIDLASQFRQVLVTGVPLLGGRAHEWIKARGTEDGVVATETGERHIIYAEGDDPARRFISLVDELYDQGVALYLETQLPPAELYQGDTLNFEYRRTLSRLTEMQSAQYLENGLA